MRRSTKFHSSSINEAMTPQKEKTICFVVQVSVE